MIDEEVTDKLEHAVHPNDAWVSYLSSGYSDDTPCVGLDGYFTIEELTKIIEVLEGVAYCSHCDQHVLTYWRSEAMMCNRCKNVIAM